MALFREPPPIERLAANRYAVRLSANERDILRRLPDELGDQIKADGDRSTFRLFPPGYSQDLGRQVEYDRLMRDDLQASHLAALDTFRDTADAEELDQDQLSVWLRAINQIRLVLGTRLDVTHETNEDDFEEDELKGPAWSLYVYLGWLQQHMIEALAE